MAVTSTLQGANDLWHARFGHVHHRGLTYLYNKEIVIGMPKLQQLTHHHEVCEGCALGQLHRLHFKKDGKGDVKARRVLQIVHSDVCGPMNVTTHRGARYFVTFIDDHSRFTWLFLMKNKSKGVSLVQGI